MPNCPATWSSATLVGEVHLSGGTMTGQQFNAQVAGQRGKAQHKCLAHLIDWALKEDLRGVTVGIPRHYCFREHPEVDSEALSIVEDVVGVLQSLGARIKDVVIPSLEYCRAAQLVILQTEAFAYHRRNLRSRPEDYGELTRSRFHTGALFTSADYIQSQRVRKVVKREFAEVLRGVDLLVTPTMTQPAAAFEGAIGKSLAGVTAPLTGRSDQRSPEEQDRGNSPECIEENEGRERRNSGEVGAPE